MDTATRHVTAADSSIVNSPLKKTASRTPRELTSEPKYSKAARRFYNENFKESSSLRLSKVLAAAGVASRWSCEELIFDGRVTVNGSVCNTPQTKVDPKKDSIYVNGNRLPKKLPPKVYLALNKPKGYICSSGESQTKSVISHPSSGLSKEYIATVEGTVHKRHLIAISEGTVIDGIHCTPDAVELLPQQPDKSRVRLRIVVHEGRNHEVRELVKSAGLQIYSLKRIRIEAFRLPPDLLFGKHIELKPPQLKALGWGEK